MVMTLVLLVYSIAQRQLQNRLEETHQTIPNQINQPTATPTFAGSFQLLQGITRVVLCVQGQLQVFIEGLTDLRKKIMQLFG